MQRDGMIEMLRDGEDMTVHYMRMSPYDVQARCVMRTRSSTEGGVNCSHESAEGFSVDWLAIDVAADRYE